MSYISVYPGEIPLELSRTIRLFSQLLLSKTFPKQQGYKQELHFHTTESTESSSHVQRARHCGVCAAVTDFHSEKREPSRREMTE